MSDYCSDCGRFHAECAHSPLWQCRVDDWRDDETQDIRATDAEDAAERFLEYCWSNRASSAGLVLAPREATEEMKRAAAGHGLAFPDEAGEIWSAMISASQAGKEG